MRYPGAVNTPSMRILGRLLAVVGVLALVYLGATAYLGYRVGVVIHQVEQNRIIRTGAHVIGKRNMERYAVHRSGLPDVLTESPAFWFMLRRME